MRRPGVLGVALALSVPLAGVPGTAASATSRHRECAPGVAAVSYSDGLDKAVRDGVTLGGLSDLAWDARSRSWASTTDNHGADPARLWFWRDPSDARVVRDPLVLKRPDGTPWTGDDSDDEGLAVLPDGDFVISSETEPSIRIFGRDGVQKASLEVPARFAVAPAGEATGNATLEGLTLLPGGKRLVAAMEGALSGDHDATLHRFLVYDRDRRGAWRLTTQWSYHAEPGLRIAEIASPGEDRLLVLEAAFDAATGNDVRLYSFAKGRKRLVADLVKCPDLGATAKQPQTNPLMDNYEGLAVRGDTIHVISDDNFGATQITRVLTLRAHPSLS
jgi:hypothetical protein